MRMHQARCSKDAEKVARQDEEIKYYNTQNSFEKTVSGKEFGEAVTALA
jgi:hypothetical protein